MNSSSWWDKKLGNPAPRVAPQPNYQPPVQPANYPMQPQYQAPYTAQTPENGQGGYRMPASATSTSRCPNCGSGNYGGATPEARPRCYDCGYPITQSGSGIPGIGGAPAAGGPVQAAKQVSTGGWNPSTIVGRID